MFDQEFVDRLAGRSRSTSCRPDVPKSCVPAVARREPAAATWFGTSVGCVRCLAHSPDDAEDPGPRRPRSAPSAASSAGLRACWAVSSPGCSTRATAGSIDRGGRSLEAHRRSDRGGHRVRRRPRTRPAAGGHRKRRHVHGLRAAQATCWLAPGGPTRRRCAARTARAATRRRWRRLPLADGALDGCDQPEHDLLRLRPGAGHAELRAGHSRPPVEGSSVSRIRERMADQRFTAAQLHGPGPWPRLLPPWQNAGLTVEHRTLGQMPFHLLICRRAG